MTAGLSSAGQLPPGFFKDRAVLVTGHTGFKGSWLAFWLHTLGAKVTGLGLAPLTNPNHFDLIGLQHLISHHTGDVRDSQAVERVFEAAQPEIVFHLAAQALVRESYDDPKTTFDTNIGGTVNVLEAVRRSQNVKAVVVVTSDKCYDNKEWPWGYRENDPLGGHDPYSASKGAAEIVCGAYLKSFFSQEGRGPHLGFATARAGNVIGGGDWSKDRIIPDCVRSLSRNAPIVIRNPLATRPWQHVLDPLHGYLLLAARLIQNPPDFNGAWNFGPAMAEDVTVDELARRFIRAWGEGVLDKPSPSAAAPHEAHLLRLNTDKAVCALKWRPVLDGAAAVDWTVGWYKQWHENPGNMRETTQAQLQAFQALTQTG